MTTEALVMAVAIFPHFFQCVLLRNQICWGRKGQNGKQYTRITKITGLQVLCDLR